MFSLRTLVLLLASAIVLVAPAEATTTYYVGSSNEAAFNTAVGGLTLLDPSLTFSGSDLVPGGLDNASGTGINFRGSLFGNPLDFTVNSGNLTATDADEITRVNFPTTPSLYAFGFHLTSTGGFASATWCIELTANACNFTVPNSSVQFFGVVSDAPLTSSLFIRHLAQSPTMVFTNFEAFGQSAVPEPQTLLLVGLGLVILPLFPKKIPRKNRRV